MSRLQLGLSCLLVIQIIITVALLLNNQRLQQSTPSTALLEKHTLQQLSKIEIYSMDGEATLYKTDDGSWQIPEPESLPVNKEQLERVFSALQSPANWPITKTQSSHARFEVGPDKFQRKLDFFNGDQRLITFFIGTSPEFRRLYIRKADDKAVYLIKLNSTDLPVDKKAWLDKGLLATHQGIKQIKGPDYQLEKKADVWTLGTADGTEDNINLNLEKVDQLISRLTKLQVQGLVENPPAETDDAPTTLTITSPTADARRYTFSHIDDHYYVRHSDYTSLFTLSPSDYENIAEIRREHLLSVDEGSDETLPDTVD